MKTTPPTITTEEADKLLSHLQNYPAGHTKKPKRIRNYCMSLLMLDAGLRVGEVVQLPRENLYFMNAPVHNLLLPAWLTKSKQERTIPLTARIHEAIKQMYKHVWQPDRAGERMWAFYNTTTTLGLTTRQVERIIRDAALKSIGRPIHPHIFRHTFASRLVRTTNTRVVQILLGHKHLSTTQIYTHPNQDDLKTAILSLETEHETFGVDLDNLPPLSDRPNRPDATDTHRDMR